MSQAQFQALEFLISFPQYSMRVARIIPVYCCRNWDLVSLSTGPEPGHVWLQLPRAWPPLSTACAGSSSQPCCEHCSPLEYGSNENAFQEVWKLEKRKFVIGNLASSVYSVPVYGIKQLIPLIIYIIYIVNTIWHGFNLIWFFLPLNILS